MARASILPDGVTAPIEIGFSIHERMNAHFVDEAQPALLLQKPDAPFDFLFKHLEGKQGHGYNYDKTATRVAHNR